MNFRNWFQKDSNSKREESEISLFTNTKFDYHDYIGNIEQELRPFATAFYEKLGTMLPPDFIFGCDKSAPEDARWDQSSSRPSYHKASLALKRQQGARYYKYGSARAEHRQNRLFAKVVAWHTPVKFLHQRSVYDLVKKFFPDSRIMQSKSRTEKGFAIKNGRHIITMEVFPGDGDEGFLAVDIALHDGNKPVAIKRMETFLEFYGHLYNSLGNADLQFKVQPILIDEFEIELVPDYQDKLDQEAAHNH